MMGMKERDTMKKYLESKKGVLMFYLVVALLAVACSYRFKFLTSNEVVNDNPIILENTLANK